MLHDVMQSGRNITHAVTQAWSDLMHVTRRRWGKISHWLQYNAHWLVIGSAISLVALGLLMGTSASIDIAAADYNDAFFFLKRQLIYLGVTVLAGLLVIRIPLRRWRSIYPWLLVGSTIGLILVLTPGIGKTVNGSARWIGLGPFNLQVSEFSKWFLVFFIADYVVRRFGEIQYNLLAFVKPMLVVGITVILLLMEPDFGASAVIVTTSLIMLFIAGASLLPFFALLGSLVLAAGLLMVFEPYRFDRLMGFWDPWANSSGSGYQLVQSLIAFGQGGITGRGLGESVQKLYYLPEAHTDFVFAVLAEELGLFACLGVVALYSLLVLSIFYVANRALKREEVFGAYACLGIGVLIAIQALLNIGVNTGLLPTKGLTLPLMSYGGSSILVTLSMIAFVLRTQLENRTSPSPQQSWQPRAKNQFKYKGRSI